MSGGGADDGRAPRKGRARARVETRETGGRGRTKGSYTFIKRALPVLLIMKTPCGGFKSGVACEEAWRRREEPRECLRERAG